MVKTIKKLDGNALDIATRTLEKGIAWLEEYVDERTGNVKAADVVIGDATDFAHLMSKVAGVTDALRKAQAEERKRSEAVTKSVVIEFIRAMDPTDGARFVKELAALHAKKSGLA